MFRFKDHIKRSLPAIFLLTLLLVLPACNYIRQRLTFGKYSMKVAEEWARNDSLRSFDSLKRAGADNKVFESTLSDSAERVMSEKKVFERTLTDSLMSIEAKNLLAGDSAPRYYIIAGSFANHANAADAAGKYITKGFKTTIITTSGTTGLSLNLLSVKTFTDYRAAQTFLMGFKDSYDPEAYIYSATF